jgi:hypothetical protein
MDTDIEKQRREDTKSFDTNYTDWREFLTATCRA